MCTWPLRYRFIRFHLSCLRKRWHPISSVSIPRIDLCSCHLAIAFANDCKTSISSLVPFFAFFAVFQAQLLVRVLVVFENQKMQVYSVKNFRKYRVLPEDHNSLLRYCCSKIFCLLLALMPSSDPMFSRFLLIWVLLLLQELAIKVCSLRCF